jgi:hypothetical protein
MNTEERPEMNIARIIEFLCMAGKFLERLLGDQSSRKRDAKRRIGIVRRLL